MGVSSKTLRFRPKIYEPKLHSVSKRTRSLPIQHSRQQTSTPSRRAPVYRTKAPICFHHWSRISSLGQSRRSRYASDMLKHISVAERLSSATRRTSYTLSQDRDSIWGLRMQRHLHAASKRQSWTAEISVNQLPLPKVCELMQKPMTQAHVPPSLHTLGNATSRTTR